LRDLDFVPIQRDPASRFTPRPDALVSGDGQARPVAFARLDHPAVPDRAAHAAGWAAGYAAGARLAAQDAAAQAQLVAEEHARTAQAHAAEHAAALAALDLAARALDAREAPVLATALATVHEAALALATALLGVELADASAAARAALARVLDTPDLPDGTVVRLHPRDAAALAAAGGAPAGLEVVPDPTLEPGDALAEHADGVLDARLRGAVDRARAALVAS